MTQAYTEQLVGLAASLTELAVKGTVTAISSKIKAIKDERSVESIRNTYDEIVNALLNEREEAVRIAQAYKSELDRIVISDEDIQHLHKTVSRVLEFFTATQRTEAAAKGEEAVVAVNEQISSYNQIKELINIDILKTMQLLGFNYKAAIGEPLTQICANAISSLGGRGHCNAPANQHNQSSKRK